MSMFDNAVLPLCAVKETSKSEVFPIDVQTNGFNEYRSTPFDWEYFVWSIPAWNILEEDKVALASFLRQRKFGLRSFKYQDPNMPELINNKIANFNGATKWKLTIAYDTNTPGMHPIFHPGAITVRRNGFIVPTAAFAIENGQPIITVPGSSPSDDIRVSGPIYFAVRLDSTFGWTIKALNSSNTAGIVMHAEIQLKEVFEY